MNFSGGKDSTYMLLEMIRRNMRIDAVVYADTTMEFPPMYEHLDQMERLLKAERGIPVTRLRPEQSFEELMFEAIKPESRYALPGHGWPNAAIRWCTGEFKIRLINSFSRTLSAKPYHYIGFAADETQRLKRKRNQDPSKRYPLAEWGVTETQALERCYQQGFHWNGLYEDFFRVSCWCCPLQSLQDLRTRQERYPKMWAELRRLDALAIAQFGRDNSFGQFRPKESVRMLELRFDFEKEWAAHGWSIRSRAFYRALDLLYQKNFSHQANSVDELLSYATPEDLQMLSIIESPSRQSKRPPKKPRKADLSR